MFKTLFPEPALINIFSCCPVNISDIFFTAFTCSDLGAGNYANLKSSLLKYKLSKLPPEVFLFREISSSFKIDSFNNIVIF